MKRRICLVGIALGVGPLALLAGNAAVASAKSKPSKPVVQRVACATQTSIVLAQGQTSVLPPVVQGRDYGPVTCGGPLGGGIEADSFNVPLSGDTLAKYSMYFRTGTIHGTYDLTPQPSSSMNFLETDWTGTLKVLGGTGAHTGDAGSGTMVCKTLDGISVTCTDKLKLRGA